MACVVESLVNIIHQYSSWFAEIDDDGLLEKALLLRDAYDDCYSILFSNGENQDLEIRIKEAAYQAEDLFIDVDFQDYFFHFDDLEEVIREFDSILEEIRQRIPVNDDTSLATSSPHLDSSVSGQQPYVVGFDRHKDQLLQGLCTHIYDFWPKIIPFVGTAGSGKTTLARQVFNHSVITNDFDIYAWVTLSQPFDLRTTLLAILDSCGKMRPDMVEEQTPWLGKYVRKTLKSRKYLIVIDDVCLLHQADWDILKMYFPDNYNYSRIMLIARNLRTINRLHIEDAINRLHIMLTPIDEDASFEIIRHRVFGSPNPFPPELEDIGRKIARNCAGFPLAIVVIANVLSRMKRTIDSWELVGKRQFFYLKEESYITEEELLNALALSPLLSTAGSTVVGFDRAISQMMHQLISTPPELQVIPIVGVGGSGKTTLARQLYDHSLITDSFKTRAWITISESFDLRVSLLELMDCLLNHKGVHTGSSDEELGENVLKILNRKKYLIVVDDIWNASAWEELRRFFPDDHNGSRIVLTTRERSWGDYVKSSSSPHEMQPMNEDESWELIVRKVFGGHDKYFPHELEEIGRKIARNCRGLPLAVTAAAGILSRSNRTTDAWNHVESCKFYSMGDKKIQDDSILKVFADAFSKDGRQLLDLISNGRQRDLQVIPIVGSGGGSGKTNLARLLYDRSLLSKRFSSHAWVTCSQHKEVAPLLRDLLASLRGINNEEPCVIDDKELAEHVHKALHGRRYLIVLDDIKDKNTWDLLRRYFQDNNDCSRIILTAREWTSDDHDKIKPLKVDPYWEFLIQKAFEHDRCSPELEEGHSKLPELVSTSEKSRASEFWKLVWQDKNERENKSDLQSDLLYMTYNHLPYHLKPCFLYMGALPEDLEIKASKIIDLWIAEGFVRPKLNHDLEDIAEAYLTDLIDRNILSACRREYTGKVAAVKIHDVFWKFCCKKAIQENFVWFKDLEGQNISEDEANVRRVSVNSLSQDTDLTGLDSVRSFLCFGRVSQGTDPTFLDMRLLRVLDVLQFEFVDFPEEMLELVNLRYLALTCRADIPSSIIEFHYLMFLIIAKALSLPEELGKIITLRHLKCKETWDWGSGFKIYEDLQSLSNVPASLMSELFLEDNYNIKKLGIFFDPKDEPTGCDLSLLHNVEVLKCTSSDRSLKTSNRLSFLKFPVSLKKLTLKFCNIPSGVMSVIGALPELEQLILQHCDFESDQTEPNWEPVEGEFLMLRVLKMEGLNLVRWAADGTHFPELLHLVIRGCRSMQEIPRAIGHTPSLQLIEVDASSPGVVESTLQIKKEIEEIGNNFLQVVVQETQ